MIQEADRVLAINDQSLENSTLEQCQEILEQARVKATFLIEFDVAGKL